MTNDATAAVVAELAALDDPKLREVNRRHGDDHGVVQRGVEVVRTDHDRAKGKLVVDVDELEPERAVFHGRIGDTQAAMQPHELRPKFAQNWQRSRRRFLRPSGREPHSCLPGAAVEQRMQQRTWCRNAAAEGGVWLLHFCDRQCRTWRILPAFAMSSTRLLRSTLAPAEILAISEEAEEPLKVAETSALVMAKRGVLRAFRGRWQRAFRRPDVDVRIDAKPRRLHGETGERQK